VAAATNAIMGLGDEWEEIPRPERHSERHTSSAWRGIPKIRSADQLLKPTVAIH
jgi:hypothetical protein